MSWSVPDEATGVISRSVHRGNCRSTSRRTSAALVAISSACILGLAIAAELLRNPTDAATDFRGDRAGSGRVRRRAAALVDGPSSRGPLHRWLPGALGPQGQVGH